MVLGGTVAFAAADATDVACKIEANVLSCPLPEPPAPVTVTETATATVTTTVTAAPTSSVAPTSASPTPSPTSASPTPTPTTTPPPASGWPAADNTGVPAGVSLTASGSMTVTQAGTVIDGKNITGQVLVKAKDVVIKNSRITGTDFWGVLTSNGGTVTIQDSEIIGFSNAIGFDNWTAIRVEVRGQRQDGVKFGTNSLLQDSWIHDLNPESGAHSDGGQLQSGETNVTIRHNTIDLGTTKNANAALFLAPDLGPTTNGPLVVENNKLNGGNYVVYCVDGNNGQYFVRDIRFTGNRFGDKFTYGRSNVNVPITQSGNVIDSTGAAYNL